MQAKVEVRKTVTTQTTMKLNRQELVTALRKAGLHIPDDSEIFVRVPGGGDWSNTDLDIDRDNALTIRFEKTERLMKLATTLKLLDDFDASAQNWGWAADSSFGRSVIISEEGYDEDKAKLIRRIKLLHKRLENATRQAVEGLQPSG